MQRQKSPLKTVPGSRRFQIGADVSVAGTMMVMVRTIVDVSYSIQLWIFVVAQSLAFFQNTQNSWNVISNQRALTV